MDTLTHKSYMMAGPLSCFEQVVIRFSMILNMAFSLQGTEGPALDREVGEIVGEWLDHILHLINTWRFLIKPHKLRGISFKLVHFFEFDTVLVIFITNVPQTDEIFTPIQNSIERELGDSTSNFKYFCVSPEAENFWPRLSYSIMLAYRDFTMDNIDNTTNNGNISQL